MNNRKNANGMILPLALMIILFLWGMAFVLDISIHRASRSLKLFETRTILRVCLSETRHKIIQDIVSGKVIPGDGNVWQPEPSSFLSGYSIDPVSIERTGTPDEWKITIGTRMSQMNRELHLQQQFRLALSESGYILLDFMEL